MSFFGHMNVRVNMRTLKNVHKRLQKIKMNVKKSISYIFLEESVVYALGAELIHTHFCRLCTRHTF
jgi:hypothetical protein